MTKTRWIIFAALVLLIFGGLIAFSKIQTASLPKSDGSNNIYGIKDSHVTLTEYVDFQCEACRAYYPTMKEIKEKYKSQVTIRIKHLPIASSHPYAKMAAGYAEAAAKQGKFLRCTIEYLKASLYGNRLLTQKNILILTQKNLD